MSTQVLKWIKSTILLRLKKGAAQQQDTQREVMKTFAGRDFRENLATKYEQAGF